jgi:hypothetical protein
MDTSRSLGDKLSSAQNNVEKVCDVHIKWRRSEVVIVEKRRKKLEKT